MYPTGTTHSRSCCRMRWEETPKQWYVPLLPLQFAALYCFVARQEGLLCVQFYRVPPPTHNVQFLLLTLVIKLPVPL